MKTAQIIPLHSPKKMTKTQMVDYCAYLTGEFNKQVALNAKLLEHMQQQINFFRKEFKQEVKDTYNREKTDLRATTDEAILFLNALNDAARELFENGGHLTHEDRCKISQQILNG